MENGNPCKHYGGGAFAYGQSSSFSWVDQSRQTVGFGPWGEMTVETGRDILNICGTDSDTVFYLSEDYSGVQYEQLDWDGGLGIPSGTAYAKEGMSNLIGDLFDQGALDPAMPYLSFDCDETTNTGALLLAGFDPSRYSTDDYLYMPWVSYEPYTPVNYMWNGKVESIQVGSETVATDKYFCLDTGSSRFKGDPKILDPILALVEASGYAADLVLTFAGGVTVTVPASVYMKTIEAGPDAGQTLPQFEPMDGLDDQLLVGSVLVDQLYTIFGFDVAGSAGAYTLTPRGMWLFNKVGGRKLVSGTSAEALDLGPRGVAG